VKGEVARQRLRERIRRRRHLDGLGKRPVELSRSVIALSKEGRIGEKKEFGGRGEGGKKVEVRSR
jgi:hypothetical protein